MPSAHAAPWPPPAPTPPRPQPEPQRAQAEPERRQAEEKKKPPPPEPIAGTPGGDTHDPEAQLERQSRIEEQAARNPAIAKALRILQARVVNLET